MGIVHRRTLPSAARPAGLRRLPVVGRLFVVLAAVVAVGELWPAVNAAWLGVTDILGELGNVLPTVFRNAAIVALPATLLWARPRASRTNPWLWKGALIVAGLQLARYPAGVVQTSMIESVDASAVTEDVLFLLVNGISLVLAFLSAMGVWALGEGLKDAGARVHRLVLAVIGVAVAAFTVALFGGAVYSEVQAGMSPALGLGLVSVLTNALFLFALGLLAARAIAGARLRLEPPRAWLLGAFATSALVAAPVLSLGLTLVQQTDREADLTSFGTILRVMAFFGWPLVAVALGMGMGAWRAGADAMQRDRRAWVRGTPRFVAA